MENLRDYYLPNNYSYISNFQSTLLPINHMGCVSQKQHQRQNTRAQRTQMSQDRVFDDLNYSSQRAPQSNRFDYKTNFKSSLIYDLIRRQQSGASNTKKNHPASAKNSKLYSFYQNSSQQNSMINPEERVFQFPQVVRSQSVLNADF
ncbi:hypothetical protein pb186bvf_016087 [Paramecium bursaria]